MRRGFPVTQVMRAERRRRADERNAEYNKLSTEEKLAKLPAEPHAARQRAKLQKLLQQAKEKVEAEKLAAKHEKNNKKGKNNETA